MIGVQTTSIGKVVAYIYPIQLGYSMIKPDLRGNKGGHGYEKMELTVKNVSIVTHLIGTTTFEN